MISIIILTFNSIRFIKPCLDSVFIQGYSDFEVVIVDNCSKDGTLDFIKQNYPHVALIENKENLGAAKARNQGIKIAKGEWIMTLDCDIILESGFLSNLAAIIGKLEDGVGMLQPKILNLDKKTVYSCGIYLSKIRRFYDIGRDRHNNGKFNKSKDIFGACSAAGIYKRKMLEDIKEDTGYFDERFFFLVEDVDLSWRAQRKGWKAKFYPELVCFHYGNSSNFDRKLRQYFCFRNRYYLMIKNEKLKYFCMNFIFLFIYDLPRLIMLFLSNPYTLKAVREIINFREHRAWQDDNRFRRSSFSYGREKP